MREKKKEETEDVMQVVEQYLPPSPERLRDAVASSRVSLEHDPSGSPALVLNNYQKPGDNMRLVLDPASKQVVRTNVSTYLDKAQDHISAKVEFARLADGTLHAEQTTIQPPEKKISIVTANTNYVKIAQ